MSWELNLRFCSFFRFHTCSVILFIWLIGLSSQSEGATIAQECQQIIQSKGKTNDSVRLHHLFEAHWAYTMGQFPETATALGYPGRHQAWTDYSSNAIQARKADLGPLLDAAKSIDSAKLQDGDATSLNLFRRNVEEDLSGTRFPSEFLAVTQMGGVIQDIPQTLQMMPGFKLQDFEDMIMRLNGVSNLVHQTISLLQMGLDSGITPPQITLRDVPNQIRTQIPDDPWKSPLLSRFSMLPDFLSNSQKQSLRDQAMAAYSSNALPAFKELYQFFGMKYVPGARTSIGMSELPNGRDWYAFNVRKSTTTRLTPKEIHQIGLSEVKRLRTEMDQLIAKTGFNGDLIQFSHFLRTDPQFFYDNPDELLRGYRDIAKRIDPELMRLFGHLPRLPYGVVPVPEYSEKSQTTAYYEPGTFVGGRPGRFYANTYDLKARPKWEMEALTLHESVPGHHLQISLAQELDIPEFRRHGTFTAFIEGWGLYAESLGDELGLYRDPYSKYGQLTYEMWRAIRLVLDTGIHSMGWSRDDALKFFHDNSSKADHDIMVEVDRYIAWPGQALAYKLGQLKIRELRKKAELKLGARFDVRKFHDAVLGNGALPLDLLEKQINEWLSRQD
ncbi:MAG: hypothetical protein JWM99_5025 [Verrucomicrobiales bacterium]|nr:hypothetical protein [Verrucomicrobiales bacterium]